jgi:RHS repeat-associated protein
LFAGQQYDKFSAQYYLRARLFDPTTGRFTQRDSFAAPLSDALSLHRYLYSKNNPVNQIDPSGKSPESDAQIWQHIQDASKNIMLGFLAASASVLLGSLIGFGLGDLTLEGAIGYASSASLFALGAVIPILGTIDAINNIIESAKDINELKKILPTVANVNAGHAQTIRHLIRVAEGTLEANLAFAVLNLATLVIAAGFIFFAPLAVIYVDLIGIGLYFVQTYANAVLNEAVAKDVMTLLNFSYAPQLGKRQFLITSTADGTTDFTKILARTFIPFLIEPWKLVSELNVIYSDSFDFRNGVQSYPGKIYAAANSAYEILNDQFTNGLTASIQITEGGTVIGDGVTYPEDLLASSVLTGSSDLLPSDSLLSLGDPRLPQLTTAGLNLWRSALGTPSPFPVNVVVEDLPAGVLGETLATAWDAQGKPTGGLILLSPNGDGRGWYIDPTPLSNSEFTLGPSASSLTAKPGTDAAGHYDLYTVLLHELGHLEGLMPDDPGFESHVQTIAGVQTFVGPGLAVPLVDSDQELDPSIYRDDVLSSTLAPGVRELPSDLDAQILQIVAQTPVTGGSTATPTTSVISQTKADPGPAFLRDNNLIVTDDSAPNDGFNVRGATVANDIVNLTDATRFNSGVWRSFVIPSGVDVFQFTITTTDLVGNGPLAPTDAFEVALLDTNTMQSLVGTADGLTKTDAFLNIQQTGQIFYGNHVNISGVTGSGQTGALDQPMTVTVDLSGVKAGTQATLYFDLLGFGSNASNVSVELGNLPLSLPSGGTGGTTSGTGGAGITTPVFTSNSAGSTAESQGFNGGSETGGTSSASSEAIEQALGGGGGTNTVSTHLALLTIATTGTEFGGGGAEGGAVSTGIALTTQISTQVLSNGSGTYLGGELIYGPNGSTDNFIVPAGDEHDLDHDAFWPWLEHNHPTGGPRQQDERNFWPWSDAPSSGARPEIPGRKADQSFWPWQADTLNQESSVAPAQLPNAKADERSLDAVFAKTDGGQIGAPIAFDSVDSAGMSDVAWAGVVAGLFALQAAAPQQDERREAARVKPRRR